MQRIAKAISAAGFCSRRKAEELIALNQVKVNKVLITSPATFVTDNDEIEISGQKLVRSDMTPRMWIYHKPAGLVTTHSDPQGRATVFQQLSDLPRVISIGRLDLNSEGLLLLTNNGDIARTFELPSSKIERIYKVRAFGDIFAIKRLKFPVVIDGVNYNPIYIKLLGDAGRKNNWFEVALTEGKNREIRKIFDYCGLQVNRLIRTAYGPFSLKQLQVGKYEELPFEKFQKFVKK